VDCDACGSFNESGRKFCGECGAALARECAHCHCLNPVAARFCGDCGRALEGVAGPGPAAEAPAVAERRVVSVLFVDLVGFTAASELRDSEDTRELLTRYFEVARTTIERYGGTIEKFIGDAVMAVWGAPVAQEDDSERSVRAALELVAAVPGLDSELRARAGVATGPAAVTLGAKGEGMVAGDLVNTASRIQSTAEPGTVLVGELTKRATEAAIGYEDAGERALKGKTEPVRLWRALRVVAGAGGFVRSPGLEAPFVGRDRELRLVKELFHASAEEARAQLVLISGVAGIGKSRLAWEFEKYIDGVAADAYWHRGRCLSYGEGVAYWALAEMVRMRCGISEDEDTATAREKLQSTLQRHIADADERRWVEPRVAHLLGLEEGAPGDEENLFSAWRILFERLAEQLPTVLVFEDVQWADGGLLDFIEYLLDWSRNHQLFVVALARPEFTGKRSTWSAKRGFTQLYLEPLGASAMEDLLSGLVPGLPDDLSARILERAEGVPLYAVETVRMLLDRGLVARDGLVYRPTESDIQLEVPETLHALVAARLDGLTTAERQLIQDGAVLGKTFTRNGLSSMSGVAVEELEPTLMSLLRKEILSVQADPRSPERGQYAFLQDIVKRIAYDTLSRKERKAKHLRAADYLASTMGDDDDEFVEVVATHYVDALEADPQAADAAAIRERACEMLVRAGERSASLAATGGAQRAFERAAELVDDPLRQGEFYERAGTLARVGARSDEAMALFERAIALFEAAEATHAAARVAARLADAMWDGGRLEDSLERMNRSFELLAREAPDADLAALAAQFGRSLFFGGQTALAMQRIETALELAEQLLLPDVLIQAMTTKAIMFYAAGRGQEAQALLRFALDSAIEHDKPSAALRASYNLSDFLSQSDRYEDAATLVSDGLAQSRRVGNRYWELAFLGQLYPFLALGEWDRALSMFGELPSDEWEHNWQAFTAGPMISVTLAAQRGRIEDALPLLDRFAAMGTSGDIQVQVAYRCGEARALLAQGNHREALAAAEQVLSLPEFGWAAEAFKEGLVVGAEAALALGDSDWLRRWIATIEELPRGQSSQFLQAQTLRFKAWLASDEDANEADRLFRRASGLFREIAMPFYLAVTQLEHAELLVGLDRAAEARPLLEESAEISERLGAEPLRKRVARILDSARASIEAIGG
jgi:predicted ATPase/class 3 adenylate cyclase